MHNSRNAFIPEEFEYPDTKIGTGKTFVYQNIKNKQEIFKELKLVNSNGNNYRTLKSYDIHSASDSVKSLNGVTIEVFNFFMAGDGNVTKGQKMRDTILHNEQKLGTHISEWTFNTEGLLYTTISEERYLKDTTIIWQNKDLPCLVTKGNAKIELQVKANTSIKHTTNVSGIFYHAKGIGIFKYSIAFIDHDGKENNNTFELTSINDSN